MVIASLFRGELLKEWRGKKGLSQKEAAEKIDITQEYWHALENHKRLPSLSLLDVISKITKIKLSQLLGEENIASATDRGNDKVAGLNNLEETGRFAESVNNALPMFQNREEWGKLLLDLAHNGQVDDPVRRQRIAQLKEACEEALV